MDERSPGSVEIEQTLRLASDAVERDIAGYRVWVFAAIVAVTAALRVSLRLETWIPTLLFLAALGWAIGLRASLRRGGHGEVVTFLSVCGDLALTSGLFYLIERFGSAAARSDNPTFATYLVAPALFLTQLIRWVRHSRAISFASAVLAPLVFLATVVPIAGFHPAQITVTVFLVIGGLISVTSAKRARQNLDTFARLQLLRRYLPPAAVERVMREDPDAALAPGGRLVTVTILAADLRGFTAMSEKLAPAEVMAQLNAYHGTMIDVIDRHGGAIDKFMGDGTLVVFGLTGSAEDGAAAAVACAGAMQGALARHNEDRARAGAPPLEMGIGVHTGPVVAGNLGVPGRRLEFTVIGDAVNTASRLEGQTKVCGTPVIVSASTASLLPEPTTLQELAPVSLRGKEQPMRVFALARHHHMLAEIEIMSLSGLSPGSSTAG